MKRKFAVFDIDGTIARTALFFQIVDQLIEDGHLPQKARKELDDKYAIYQSRTHSEAFYDYSQQSVEVLFSNMHTLSIVDYRKAVDKVIEKTKSHVYTYTRDLTKELKDKGYFIVALSGSEIYAVEKFTEQFNFDLAIGETYHEKDGILTGEAEEVFKKKNVFLKKFVEDHELSYEGSIGVGDTKADVKMLELTENPIAFNPEINLYNHAIENGWKIVVERKNVIYKLEPKNGSFVLA